MREELWGGEVSQRHTQKQSLFMRWIDEVTELVGGLIQTWDRYWFCPASLQRLAVCRLLAFGLLIADLIYFDFSYWGWAFYHRIDPMFYEPILFLRVLQRAFGFGPPPPVVLGTIYIAILILAIGAFVGYRTRICVLGSSVLFIYLIAVTFSWFGRVHHTHGAFALLLLACPSALAERPFRWTHSSNVCGGPWSGWSFAGTRSLKRVPTHVGRCASLGLSFVLSTSRPDTPSSGSEAWIG